MKPEILNTALDVRTANGLDDILLDALEIQVSNGDIYRAPIGSATDGVSTPRWLWPILPPTGDDWLPAVLHDAAYRNTLQRYCPATDHWQLAKLTQAQADRLLLEALRANGVRWLKRTVIYTALRLVGGKAFKEDRA